MAPSHNVVLLVDTAESSDKSRLRRVSLRLLNFLACRAGLGQVRWSYRFLNSSGGRCRPPRRSDLRELGPRGWEEFEDELEACWERARNCRPSSTQSSRAQLLQTALMETLADFQWDRPDITSPTKPTLLRSRRGRIVAADEPLKDDSPDNFINPHSRNSIFLLSSCPHSGTELGQFAATSGDFSTQKVMDKLLPKSLQKIVSSKRVRVYWLDTSDWTQFGSSSDHSGYWTMVELMHQVEGRILPSESILGSSCQKAKTLPSFSVPPINIPFESVLNYLIFSEPDYQLWFPRRDGILFLTGKDGTKQLDCAVSLEPVSMIQKLSTSLMTIELKGTMQNCNLPLAGLRVETWLLHNSDCVQLQKLTKELMLKELHMIATVTLEDDVLPRTGILSPLSETAAVLNVICSERTLGLDNLHVQGSVHETDKETFSDLPDIVMSVLNHVYSSEDNTLAPDFPVPEWIKQELSQSSRWTSSVTARWYPLSGVSGASCNLMESFRLINAASSNCDEHLKFDQELTNYLSEFYQKKSVDDAGLGVHRENQKKSGLPRTPVRQKMKTLPRALQMLNAARLNVKAQKADSTLPVPNEKNSQMKRRSSGKQDNKPKQLKPTEFQSEDGLISYIKENYEEAVSLVDHSTMTWARDTLTTIKSYLKSIGSEQIETEAIDKVKLLFKTSKVIRQNYRNNQDKEVKLKECQLQVFLRLEMFVQCPVIQMDSDELELIIEEITDILRIVSLTEDPLFLTKFLEVDVLTQYIASVPKILADIYFSLGTQIPEVLVLVLPSDGDDSIMHEEKSVKSQPSTSRVPSVAPIGAETDQLEDLRTRSAKKRRSTALARHRSVAESSQSFRQIEVPKRQPNKENVQSNAVVVLEKLKLPLPAQPQKDAEAKVRRNLFIQETRSPSKRCSKMPRSQSVSAVESLKRKRSKSHDGSKDHHKLLTKKVSETPVHKQTANRLLLRQIKGRPSESNSNISIVEESPEKEIRDIDLRRSPRIKQLSLTRRNSSSFYASQPKSRNLERVNSATQLQQSRERPGSCLISEVKTPKRLLFGEVLGMISPPTTKRSRRILDMVNPVYKTPGKTPRKTPSKNIPNFEDQSGNMLVKSPCTPYTPRTPSRTPKRLKTPSKGSTERKKAAKNLGKLFSPSKPEEKSPLKLWGRRSERLAQMTPGKDGSPYKQSVCQTLMEVKTPQKLQRLESKDFRTPSRTPTRSNNTTPAKQSMQISNTPRKSDLKHPQEHESRGPSGYILWTPQKRILASVPHTPILQTPQKPISASVPRTPVCRTPQKAILSSVPSTPVCQTPNKAILTSVSRTPVYQTPQKAILASVMSTPVYQTPQKPVLASVPTTPILKTPQRSALASVSHTPSPKKYIMKELTVAITRMRECTPEKVLGSNLSSSATPSSALKSFCSEKTTSVCQTPKKSSIALLKPCDSLEFSGAPERLMDSLCSNKDSTKAETACTVPSQISTQMQNVINAGECTDSLSQTSVSSPSIPFTDKSLSPDLKDALSDVTSSKAEGVTIVSEKLDSSSMDSQEATDSFINSSQTEESIDISEARVVSTEASELKMKVLITRKPSGSGVSYLPTTPKCLGNVCSTSTYGLRCTPDRRQREAAARLGTPEIPAKFSTPKSHCKMIPQSIYEVELEMQESGLPKLRFKRTDSNSTIDMDVNKTPKISRKRKGDESPFNEKWCSKHAVRTEPACVSPSCVRTSHYTPGKSGIQTFICQSYTPNRCLSAAASPSQSDAGVPWTPSPKEKLSTDVINSWPRKKKASALCTNLLKCDKIPEYAEEDGGDFELEGVSKLLEKSPVIEQQSKVDGGTFGLRSRKRVFSLVSPTKETENPVKRVCTFNRHEDSSTATHRHQTKEEMEIFSSDQSRSSYLSSSQQSICDDVFNMSDFTPPSKVPKNPLSACGLLTLTQSPLLYKGKTPSSKRKEKIQDVFSDGDSDHGTPTLKRPTNPAAVSDDSPFRKVNPLRSISKTYSRKKLIT
ncbi:treslin [Xenopus laevis]|uniref:Treslin n=1 Tax=Xenopus laevis TaxID=8355 RepID=TICRR_XENLA|nr:treslin [Xenopus laevis]D3IUT5.1 RecName: Full=Treslin; AltName: Full=TopBP1-interacting checkpoint and replication regulator; AltName: Full=TopBP1-interacting, replication-stimulating protein [Xenopus laevis]ADC30134.1 Treslin [Xenopus laevis]